MRSACICRRRHHRSSHAFLIPALWRNIIIHSVKEKKTTTTSRSDETWYFSKKEKQASLDSAYDTAHTRTSSAGWSEDWPGLAQCNAQKKKKKKKNECKHFVLSFLSLCYLTQCHRTIAHWPRFFFSSFFTFSALLVAET